MHIWKINQFIKSEVIRVKGKSFFLFFFFGIVNEKSPRFCAVNGTSPLCTKEHIVLTQVKCPESKVLGANSSSTPLSLLQHFQTVAKQLSEILKVTLVRVYFTEMAGDETMESETLQKNVKPEETLDMESQIKAAMRARVSHFRQQAEYVLSICLFVFLFLLVCFFVSIICVDEYILQAKLWGIVGYISRDWGYGKFKHFFLLFESKFFFFSLLILHVVSIFLLGTIPTDIWVFEPLNIDWGLRDFGC